MAKLIGPLHSTEARGRVGGVVYNTWRGLATAKAKTSPSQPRTARQLIIRAFLTTYTRLWQTLGAVAIAAWNAYAAAHTETDWTGSPKRLTGADWHTRLNVRLADMGKTAITTPPVVAPPAAVAALVLTGGAGQISCAHTAMAGTDLTIDYWDQGPMSAGIVPKLTAARHKTYSPGETTPNVLTGLTPGLHTIWARCVSEVTGLASTWVNAQAAVT